MEKNGIRQKIIQNEKMRSGCARCAFFRVTVDFVGFLLLMIFVRHQYSGKSTLLQM